MPTTLLMLPPQSDKTRAWSKRLQEAAPSLTVVVAETDADAARAIGNADAAFGTMPDALLAKAGRLRWLQAPQAAPPAGYYTPALIAHPVVVTNFREIYNDTIGAHIMAFVLAFAREGEHEGHDVGADRVVVDLAEVRDDHRMRDQSRRVVAGGRRRLRRLQPAQPSGFGEQRVGHRAERGVGVADGTRGVRVGLRDDDGQAGDRFLEALRPGTSLVGLRREHEQGGWHDGWRVSSPPCPGTCVRSRA